MTRTTYVFRNGELVKKPERTTLEVLNPGHYTATFERIELDPGSMRMRVVGVSNVEPVKK